MSIFPDVIEVFTAGNVNTINITETHSVIDVILPTPTVVTVDVDPVGIQGPQGPPGPLSDEIIIQPTAPSTSGSYELWINSGTAALDQYAKIGSTWTLTGGSNEVVIQAADPGPGYDLWYDTDDTLVVDAFSWTPTGTIRSTIVTSVESGWLAMDGSSYTNADSAYSALWAVVPTSWKSGTTLTLPDTRDRFPMGSGALGIGAVGGSNSLTLVTANLPAHNHDMGHNHAINVSSDNAAHTHPASSTISSLSHSHPINVFTGGMNTNQVHSHAQNIVATNGATAGLRADFDADTNTGNILPQGTGVTTGGANIDHVHAINNNTDAAAPAPTITTSITTANAAHSHNASATAFAGNTGLGAGTSTPINSTPACFIVVWKIKT